MNKRPINNVLLISNAPEDARKIGEMFNDQGSYSFALTRVERLADAETYFATHSADVVLLDLVLLDSPDLEKLLKTQPAGRASIVLLCELKDEAIAMRALEGGVQDYLVKGGMEPHELMRALRNSVARKVLEEALFSEHTRAQITLESIGCGGSVCLDRFFGF